jgi:hypothetical protein
MTVRCNTRVARDRITVRRRVGKDKVKIGIVV